MQGFANGTEHEHIWIREKNIIALLLLPMTFNNRLPFVQLISVHFLNGQLQQIHTVPIWLIYTYVLFKWQIH